MTRIEDVVDRLIATHGEQGLCPTRRDWTLILQCPPEQPLDLLNLLRFNPSVSTPEGMITGSEAYQRYAAAVGPAFRRVGAEVLVRNQVAHSFGTHPETSWHAAILSRYPTPLALAEFWLDATFVSGHAHRAHGVEVSRVLVLGSFAAR